MTATTVVAGPGSDRSIEILSEDEERYVGLVRNMFDCIRKRPGADTELNRVERALLAAGASRAWEGEDLKHRKYTIRGVCFAILECAYDDRRVELRFERFEQ
jgi:hypothetical protein